MALSFSNAMASLTAGVQSTIYTVPVDTSATVFGMSVANTSANPGLVDVLVGSTGTMKYLVKGAPLPVGGTMIAIGGSQKVVLVAGQKVDVVVNNGAVGAVTADVVTSFMLQ